MCDFTLKFFTMLMYHGLELARPESVGTEPFSVQQKDDPAALNSSVGMNTNDEPVSESTSSSALVALQHSKPTPDGQDVNLIS